MNHFCPLLFSSDKFPQYSSLIIVVHSKVSKRNELFIAVDLYDSHNLYIPYLLILLSALLEVISLNSRVIALFFSLTVSIPDYVLLLSFLNNAFGENKFRYMHLLFLYIITFYYYIKQFHLINLPFVLYTGFEL